MLRAYRSLPQLLLSDGGLSDPLGRVILGLALAVVLLVLVGALLRRRLFDLPLTHPTTPEAHFDSEARRRHDAHWFIQLRWLAVAVALGLIACAAPQARGRLLGWWSGLVAANLGFALWARRGHLFEAQIVVQAAVDLVILTGFLNSSGGLENPLYIAYVFHVIVGRILLPARKALPVTLAAMGLFSLLAFGEYLHLLPHYANFFFPHPDPPAAAGALHGTHYHPGASHAAYDLYFVLGRTVPFLVILLLTDFFVAAIVRRLRGSERNLAQAARVAQLERERLAGVVDAAGVGMMQVDLDVALRWFSGRLAGWFGWNAGAVGQRCPLLDAAEGCETCVVRRTLATGRPAAAEQRSPGDHGDRIFRHASSPVRDASGSVVQVVEVIEDVTSRRLLEAEAIRAGKLSVLGRMAAGIAHEIGNPLSSIASRLSLLERRKDEAFVSESVGVLREQIARITRIVHGVSHFARVRRRDRTVWPVNPLVEEVAGVVELDRRAKDTRFEMRLEEPSPRVRAVRDQIEQILLNLLLNAVEAMPTGGRVRVSSSHRADEVRLAVEDEGPGIDDATRGHLFEPFFTTKPDGTGLGLSISSGLAATHGGRIEVEGPPSGGATFVLVLPAEGADLPDAGEQRGAAP